jgi:futalosine hydrolase
MPSSGSPTLLLFPTDLERRRFADAGGLAPGFALAALAGFGPLAAAARTAGLLSELRPRRVLLVGIAGAYDAERHPVGSALGFARVALDGVGAGAGRAFLGPAALGFPQWPGSPRTTRAPVVDELALAHAPDRDDGLLLTTCAASGSPAEAAERRERFPDAVAEDMEGFAVALACALARVPAAVVRGISNRAGERDAATWRVPAALAAARGLARELLAREEWVLPAPEAR